MSPKHRNPHVREAGGTNPQCGRTQGLGPGNARIITTIGCTGIASTRRLVVLLSTVGRGTAPARVVARTNGWKVRASSAASSTN
jgi:hypothetical protein